jgi:putative tributyrin esterase
MAPIKPAGRIRTISASDPRFESKCIRFLTLYSPALGGRGDVSVFAPPGIESHTSVPLVLLLHGVYDSHWAWFFKGGAHKVALDLMAKSQMRPMLLVAPSDGLYQDGSAYLRHSGRNYETWITNDVIEGVTSAFACIGGSSPVFIAGVSMGGYGALRLGLKHADLFRGISAHSAITRFEEMLQFVSDPFPFECSDAAEIDLLSWIERNREILPPLRFDCGMGDRLIEGNRRFHNELNSKAIPHQYIEFDGEHNWPYWHAHVSSSFLFFESILHDSPKARGLV